MNQNGQFQYLDAYERSVNIFSALLQPYYDGCWQDTFRRSFYYDKKFQQSTKDWWKLLYQELRRSHKQEGCFVEIRLVGGRTFCVGYTSYNGLNFYSSPNENILPYNLYKMRAVAAKKINARRESSFVAGKREVIR